MLSPQRPRNQQDRLFVRNDFLIVPLVAVDPAAEHVCDESDTYYNGEPPYTQASWIFPVRRC